jgi:hypothetical protein
MRTLRATAGAAVLAALVLLSGCGGTPDPPAALTPVDVHQRMKTQLQQANTGAFEQRLVSVQGAGELTTRQSGRYDLKAGSWLIHLRYTSQPPGIVEQMPREQRLGADAILVDSRVYVSLPGGPKALRGRWQEGIPLPSDGSGRKTFLAALFSLQPIAVTPSEHGWTLRGRVSAVDALKALGADGLLRADDVALEKLTGGGEVTVQLGPDYAPTQLQIDGNSVSVKSGLPTWFAKDLPFMRTTTELKDLGHTAPITAPKDLVPLDPRTPDSDLPIQV